MTYLFKKKNPKIPQIFNFFLLYAHFDHNFIIIGADKVLISTDDDNVVIEKRICFK